MAAGKSDFTQKGMLATGPAGATREKTKGDTCIFLIIGVSSIAGMFLSVIIGGFFVHAFNSYTFILLATAVVCAGLDEVFCSKCQRENVEYANMIAQVASLPAANPYDLLPVAGKSFTTHNAEKGVIAVGDTFIHLDPETFRFCHNIGHIDLAQIKALHELQARRA